MTKEASSNFRRCVVWSVRPTVCLYITELWPNTSTNPHQIWYVGDVHKDHHVGLRSCFRFLFRFNMAVINFNGGYRS